MPFNQCFLICFFPEGEKIRGIPVINKNTPLYKNTPLVRYMSGGHELAQPTVVV